MLPIPKKKKPEKTFVDYLVIALSPVLIMLLVGSFVFFLIEVFYQGTNTMGIRWVMFWFVIAIVLVSRIGIENGTMHAGVYGLALAVATWCYLLKTHPAFLIGLVMLAAVWWAANRLVYDCTFVDDDQDASGHGLLHREPPKRESTPKGSGVDHKKHLAIAKRKQHSPGLWVVIFSLAALPLFGVGQMLLPTNETASRGTGFALLFIYMFSAFGLLLSTSFLGLRRYLRQRFVQMPDLIAFGWIKSGIGITLVVLVVSLFLPRPGATYAWVTLSEQVDSILRKASDYAILKSNPSGEEEGREGNRAKPGANDATDPSAPPGQDPRSASQREVQSEKGTKSPSQSQERQSSWSQSSGTKAQSIHSLLKGLLILAVVLCLSYLLFRHRHALAAMASALWHAIMDFIGKLRPSRGTSREASPSPCPQPPKPKRFTEYTNPFATGKHLTWTPQELVVYSFEALQAWAREHGVESRPEQTPTEYCRQLGASIPTLIPLADPFIVLYGHAVYATRMPTHYDPKTIQRLWSVMLEMYHEQTS